jgi:hypothetical protein
MAAFTVSASGKFSSGRSLQEKSANVWRARTFPVL